MHSPQVHVPFSRVDEFIGFIRQYRVNPELYFTGEDLDGDFLGPLRQFRDSLDYDATFTIHAPFMDLSPGAVDPKVREVTIERFSRTLDAAALLGAGAVVVHSGYEKWKYDFNVELWLKNSVRTWQGIIEKASEVGARLAVENIFEDEPSNLVLLMRELGSEHFGICFDTGHMNIFSSVPLAEWLDALVPHIIELHLHDNNRDKDAHLPVGDGSFDFGALFGALKGREVICTVEAMSPDAVKKSIERLKEYCGS